MASKTPTPFACLGGRRAVVTGASSGIGRAIALELARAGADVAIHCRRSISRAEAVAAEVRSFGVRSTVLAEDLATVLGCKALIDRAWDDFGRVDIWINNAGADILTTDARQLDYAGRLQLLLDTDVRGTMLVSRQVGERMRAAGGGVLLTIGWDQADRGMEGESGELFAATKNAVMGFTRSLALSLAPTVRVNCLAPGWIRTAWGETAGAEWQQRVLRETPLARWGLPEDVAKFARFLCSDDASYITGQVINVNGGAER